RTDVNDESDGLYRLFTPVEETAHIPHVGRTNRDLGRSRPALRARARLVRVVEGDPDDGRRNPLLLSVELSDFDLGPELAVPSRHTAEGDVLLEDRAARPARDDAHLLAPLVDAVAVPGRLVP